MTTTASMRLKLDELKKKLKNENESRQRDRLMEQQRDRLMLDFPRSLPSSPSVGIRDRSLYSPPAPITRRTVSTADECARLKEIYANANVLTLGGERYTNVEELIKLGDLGAGTSGRVVRMRHKPTGTILAVKQMRRSGNDEENKRIMMDIDVVLRCSNCPYIVQCFGYFITDADVWICMELMSTCLDKLMKALQPDDRIPEPILGKMTVAIVKALHYLKETSGVIHRDVKPSNMLLNDEGVVKLCDFGISGRLVNSKAKTREAGVAAYMAPERLDVSSLGTCGDVTRKYDIRADVWSLGISLVELATGRSPYHECKHEFEVLAHIVREPPPRLSVEQGFSPEFCAFVAVCLTKKYTERPKYDQLLRHEFLKHYESADVDIAGWFATVKHRLPPSTLPPSSPHFF